MSDARFTVRPSSDDDVFYLVGELDLAFADALEDAVRVPNDGDAPVVLDLSDLAFVDSTGIRSFIRLADRLRPRPLVLRSPRPNVATVLGIIRIDTMGVEIEELGGGRADDGPGA